MYRNQSHETSGSKYIRYKFQRSFIIKALHSTYIIHESMMYNDNHHDFNQSTVAWDGGYTGMEANFFIYRLDNSQIP